MSPIYAVQVVKEDERLHYLRDRATGNITRYDSKREAIRQRAAMIANGENPKAVRIVKHPLGSLQPEKHR